MNEFTFAKAWKYIVQSVLALVVFMGGCMYIKPQYRVWQMNLEGQAQLAEADWNRQIKVREASAAREGSVFLAQAEVERAKGVAEANKIIGDSLHGNEAYLRYLWVNGIANENNKIIYVPTEANLPILEAGRAK